MLFKDLPLDVKRHAITEFIRRPTDLKALCLTSKDMRELANPVLYRMLQLHVGGSEDLRLTALLNSNNPGLQHVRHIDLRLEQWTKPLKNRIESDDSSNDENGEPVEESVSARFAQLAVRMLLDYLPRDTLETFTWHPWQPLSVDNYMLLCKKQKKLQSLELGPVDRPLKPYLDKDSSIYSGFNDLKRIELYPNSLDSLVSAHEFIKAQPKFKTLRVISSGFVYSRTGVSPEGLHDSSTQPGLISRTLFSHFLPFESCTPHALKSLVIEDLDVRYAADTWIKIIKFPSLEKLEIRECAGVDAFWAQLSKPHIRPTKLRKLRWMDENRTDTHALDAFEGFMDGISTLEVLNIWLGNMDHMPKVEAIIRSKATLKSLAVHCQDDPREVYIFSEENLNRICSECTEIRELSIMFPEMYISEIKPPAEFQIFLDIVKKLQSLVTLNIRRWPCPRDWFEGSFKNAELQLRFYEHSLQRLTQMIFESADTDAVEFGYGLGDRSRLAIVAWGPPGQSRRDQHSDKYSMVQIPYVRGKAVDPFGSTSLLAMKSTWRLASYIEPECTILQHSLNNMFDPDHGLVPNRIRPPPSPF